MLELLDSDPRSLTSIRNPRALWAAHVVDSLTGMPRLEGRLRIADLGSGNGFPGFVVAAALPEAHVVLLESVTRKCEFMRETAAEAGFQNVTVVDARSEEHAAAAGREAYDAVTARAVARLATLAELASPLLGEEGVLVAWKGKRNPGEEAELERALEPTAMRWDAVEAVGESSGYEHRHIHTLTKAGPTPANLPRRPGMAKKRPLTP